MRFWNAFSVMLYGLGALSFIAGLLGGPWNWKMGIVVAVGLWVIGVTVRVYTFSRDEDEEFGNYEPRRLYER